jgi:hypothetical protein
MKGLKRLNEDFDYDIEDMEDIDDKADILVSHKRKFINVFSTLKRMFDREWPELWEKIDLAGIDDDDAALVKDQILNTIGRIIKNDELTDIDQFDFPENKLRKSVELRLDEALKEVTGVYYTNDDAVTIVEHFLEMTQDSLNGKLSKIAKDLRTRDHIDAEDFIQWFTELIEGIIQESIQRKSGKIIFNEKMAINIYADTIEDMKK